MSYPESIHRMVQALATTLCGSLLVPSLALADIIKLEDMLHGATMTRAQCDAIKQAVWRTVDGQYSCVRYYLSTAGGEGSTPVVFLQGDRFGDLDAVTNSYLSVPEDQKKDIDTGDLVRVADGFSKLTKTTAIYLARVGVEGTSGNHIARKTRFELDLMDAALEAIKLRYGFVGFHLVGQSGGSKLVGGLIGLRSDIVCAVSGSGPLSEAASSEKGPPDRSYFDAADSISAAVKNPSLRLFVVTDPMDRKVPASQQTPYVQKMFREGGQVSQYFVEALGEDHHDTLEYSRLVAAGCILGRSDEQIGRAIQTIVLRNSDLNERRRRERAAKAHATSQLPSSHRSAPMGVGSSPNIPAAESKMSACSATIDRAEKQRSVALGRCGLALLQKKDYEGAIAAYNEAIGLNPNEVAAFINRGNAWQSKGDNDRAIEDYTQALRLDPKNAIAFRNRGLAFQDKRRWEFDAYLDEGWYETIAIHHFDQALMLRPNFHQALNDRGNAHLALRQYAQALDDFNHAIQIDPNEALYFKNRANVLRFLEQYDRPISDYRQALTLKTDPIITREVKTALREL